MLRPLPVELEVIDRGDRNRSEPDFWLFLRLLVFFSADPLIDSFPILAGGGAGGGGITILGMSCLKHIFFFLFIRLVLFSWLVD